MFLLCVIHFPTCKHILHNAILCLPSQNQLWSCNWYPRKTLEWAVDCSDDFYHSYLTGAIPVLLLSECATRFTVSELHCILHTVKQGTFYMLWVRFYMCVTFIYTQYHFIFYSVDSFHSHCHYFHIFFLVMVVQIYICAGPGGTSNASASPHVSISRAKSVLLFAQWKLLCVKCILILCSSSSLISCY